MFDYVDGAAWDEVTKQRNESDLRSLALRPRMLVGATEIDLSTEVLGRRVEIPLLGAPTGLTGLVHHEGEVGIARAVHGGRRPLRALLGGVAHARGRGRGQSGPRWFQLYVGRDRGLAQALLERARATGYEASWSPSTSRARAPASATSATASSCRRGSPRARSSTGCAAPRWTANFLSRPRILLREPAARAWPRRGRRGAWRELIGRQFDPALSWRDIAWVQEHWDGPLLIKGILRGDDARQAAGLGLAGVIVSNHGGRQLDHATSTIRALPEIVDAAGGELEVYMDGGIRRGVDIIRALALGARGVPGRPRARLRARRPAGRPGAQRAMEILVDELRLAMTLLGCPSVRELDATLADRARPSDDEERMEHVIDPTRVHHAWNRDREPTLRIADGDSVRFALRMAGAEQIREGDSYADTDFIADQIYWLLGPVFVEGARPGDTLRVDILSLRPGEWGWCGTEPDLGLLPADFPDPFVKTFDLRGRDSVTVCPEVEIPLSPFLGTMGTHPDEPGDLPVVPAPSRRRQHRHPPPHRGQHAVAAGVVRGRAVLLRGSPRGAGRRRGVPGRAGVRHGRDAALQRRAADHRRAPVSHRRAR